MSSTAVKIRINKMPNYVKETMISTLKHSFSLQIDKSTDVDDQENLLDFVHFELRILSKKKCFFSSPCKQEVRKEEYLNVFTFF